MRVLNLALGALLLATVCSTARAEPYLAVRMGLKCAVCHENPTGGGLRTAFGNVFAQSQLPARTVDPGELGPWAGALSRWVSLGADLRSAATVTEIPGRTTGDEFGVQEARLYLQLNPLPDRLALYVDQRFAPGASTNLEAYGKLWFANRRAYVKAGQMYLPYGLRLEDDTAFVRQVPGINMTTPDSAVELGWESGLWSAQFALGNGTAGAPEQDQGKQWSLRAERVQSTWRLGASANFNDSDAGNRQLVGVHAGLRTGPLAWLAEVDNIADDAFPGGRRNLWTALLETNWNFAKGHNLKATIEGFDPDSDIAEDEQSRFSLFWEYTPLPFVQLRVGARAWEGIPQNPLQNRRLFIAELHAFF
jgi:hypothetical protein